MMFDIKAHETPNTFNEKPFLVHKDSVMKIAFEVHDILQNTGKIRIKGKGETCSSTVSVANIITENILKGNSKTEKIIVDSDIADDGQMVSVIEITISKMMIAIMKRASGLGLAANQIGILKKIVTVLATKKTP